MPLKEEDRMATVQTLIRLFIYLTVSSNLSVQKLMPAFIGFCYSKDASTGLSEGEIAYKVKNVDKDVNLFQVTDGNYYLKAVTSENQDDMMDCRMYKSKTKAKTLMQSSEANTKIVGNDDMHVASMSLNFRLIGPPTAEFAALERLKKSPYAYNVKRILAGTDKIDQMLSKCGDVRNAKLSKSRRNNNFVDPKSDTFNYNLVKGKPFRGDFKTGAPSGAGSHFAIYPGTKWCGYENIAESMEDLGVHNFTDSCCRTHDHCPYYIDRFETKFHYYNYHPWTVSHCDCDQHLYQCLKEVNTATSNEVGKLFFGMLDVKCFKFHDGSYCSNESSLLSKLWCKKTSGPVAVMQAFPLKWSKDTSSASSVDSGAKIVG